MKAPSYCLLSLALCVAMPLAAADPAAGENPDTKVTKNADASVAMPGMRAGIDRNTGCFRELTPAEVQELSARGNGRGELMAMLRRGGVSQPETAAEAEAAKIVLPNGAEIMPVPLDLMVSLEARIDADGNVVTGHSDHSIDQHSAKEQLPHE
jgi:hypothetical protein